MSSAITVAMWIHVFLNTQVVYEPTENPIWGELRVIPALVSTLLLWCILWVVAVGSGLS